jgi:hypothetical protein
MWSTNECLSDSTYFKIDIFFLSQDIENLRKFAELFFIERRAVYRREAPIGWRTKAMGILIRLKVDNTSQITIRVTFGDWILIARVQCRWCRQFCEQASTINIQFLKIDSKKFRLWTAYSWLRQEIFTISTVPTQEWWSKSWTAEARTFDHSHKNVMDLLIVVSSPEKHPQKMVRMKWPNSISTCIYWERKPYLLTLLTIILFTDRSKPSQPKRESWYPSGHGLTTTGIEPRLADPFRHQQRMFAKN